MVNILSGNNVAQKVVGNIFWQKVFSSLWMGTFRIWLLETAIMQAKLQLSHKNL